MEKIKSFLARQDFFLLTLFALACLVYAPSIGGEFYLDDSHAIVQNSVIHTWKSMLIFWQSGSYYSASPDNYGYRPLIVLSNIFCWMLGGGTPAAFQIFKKIFFGFCGILFFFFLQKILPLVFKDKIEQRRESFWLSVFGALLFVLHPAQTETVNYISATSSLLCGFFYLLALCAYVYKPNAKGIALSCLCYFLACMCKEEGITLLAVIFFFSLLIEKRSFKQSVLTTLPFIATALLVVAVLVHYFEPSSDIARGTVSRAFYFMTGWKAYLFYWSQFFVPVYFNADNLDFTFVQNYVDPLALLALAGNILVVVVAFLFRKRSPLLFWGVLVFYIGASPTTTLVPLAEAVNDHRCFIAAIGAVLVLIELLRLCSVAWQSQTKLRAAVCYLLVLVALSFARSVVWGSPALLERDIYNKNPTSPRAKNNYSLILLNRADFVGAEKVLRECLVVGSQYSYCRINLAIALRAQGREKEAEQLFRDGMDLDPVGINSRMFYAEYLLARGRFTEAEKLLEEADAKAKGNNSMLNADIKSVRLMLGKQ